MRYGSARIAVMVVMLSWLLWVPRAFAEPYVGGYLGLALAADSDFADTDFIGNVLVLNEDFSTNVDNSVTFGVRAGYWFDFLPLIGTQFDLYVFSPNLKITEGQMVQATTGPTTTSPVELPVDIEFDVTVVALGFSVLGRYPFLKSPEFPRGRLQPYLGLGPAIFITSWDAKTPDPPLDDNLGSETVVNGGLQFMAGASFFIRERLSAFAEYKFTHHVTQIGGIAGEEIGGTFSLVGNQPFNISHLTVGATYHFY